MFRGSSFHTIDQKGRIIIPARFRDIIKAGDLDGIMVSRWDGCLYGYTFQEWRRIEERILSISETSESMRSFKRFFIGGASECLCDKQGRILIPPPLREYAALEKEIALVGVLTHFEIWSRDRLEGENRQVEKNRKKEDFGNEIAKLGL